MPELLSGDSEELLDDAPAYLHSGVTSGVRHSTQPSGQLLHGCLCFPKLKQSSTRRMVPPGYACFGDSYKSRLSSRASHRVQKAGSRVKFSAATCQSNEVSSLPINYALSAWQTVY